MREKSPLTPELLSLDGEELCQRLAESVVRELVAQFQEGCPSAELLGVARKVLSDFGVTAASPAQMRTLRKLYMLLLRAIVAAVKDPAAPASALSVARLFLADNGIRKHVAVEELAGADLPFAAPKAVQ